MENKYLESFNKLPSVDENHSIHLNRYKNFILTRPERKFKLKSGLVRHHICPISFGADKSFSKESWNIIVLTEREHFIAHLILYKCYGGKMVHAFWNFQFKNTTTYYKGINSRQYKKLREEYCIRCSINSKGHSLNQEAKEKISKKLINNKNGLGKKKSIKEKENLRILHLDKNNFFYGKIYTEEEKQKIKEQVKGSKNPFYNKKHSTKTKLLMSLNNGMKRKVLCIDTNEIFDSVTDASNKMGITISSISKCCLKRQKTAGKLCWKYLSD
jgi:group I intron endonuclease